MIHQYTEITTYDGDDYEEFFAKLQIIGIFRSVIDEFHKNPAMLKRVILYIMYVYSVDSPKIGIGMDWGKTKGDIFRSLEFPDDMYSEVVHLHNDAVRTTALKWLDAQDHRVFKLLTIQQDLYTEMQSAALDRLRKPDGISIDYDQKFKCLEHAEALRRKIYDMESELQQNSKKLKEAYVELRKNGKEDLTFSIEKHVKQKPKQ